MRVSRAPHGFGCGGVLMGRAECACLVPLCLRIAQHNVHARQRTPHGSCAACAGMHLHVRHLQYSFGSSPYGLDGAPRRRVCCNCWKRFAAAASASHCLPAATPTTAPWSSTSSCILAVLWHLHLVAHTSDNWKQHHTVQHLGFIPHWHGTSIAVLQVPSLDKPQQERSCEIGRQYRPTRIGCS